MSVGHWANLVKKRTELAKSLHGEELPLKSSICRGVKSLGVEEIGIHSGRTLTKPSRRRANGPALRARSEEWSESGPTRRREQASFRLSGDTHSRTGPRFLQIPYSHHTRTHIFSRACSFSSSVSERASFQLVGVTRKFLLNFL